MTLNDWSFVIAPLGVPGLWFIGSHHRGAWAYMLGVECCWMTWAILTTQYGFILSSIGYATVHILNWRRWRTARSGTPTTNS